MGKINFDKVEQALVDGLIHYGIQQLLYLADLSSSFGEGDGPTNGPFDDPETKALSINTLLKNLQILRKKDKDLYKRLGINQKELKNWINDPSKITDEEWEKVREIRKNLDKYRREIREKIEKISDEDIVASERKKQKNRRFNVQDDWLPLQ